jgi:hypothetical protein
MSSVEDDIRLIQGLVEWAGTNVNQITKKAGMANTTINRFANGSAQGRLHRDTIGKLKAAYPDYPGFAGDLDVPALRASSDDDVEIQQWDVAYGMGAGGYLDLPVTGETHKFSRSWLRQFTSAPPEKIFLADGTGDSMFPTILDADKVMIDTTQREVRMADRIWAAAYGQTGIIKRLRPSPDGSVKILSDNPSVPVEVAYDGELHVVGRVVAIVRKT